MLNNPKWNEVKTEPSDADIYNEAANLIERYGHAKHEVQSPTGALCVYGAMSMACTGDPWLITHRGHELVGKLTGNDICSWNNREETTQADAIALLRKAALNA